jgi:hypothetical protein|tara:strand:- start:5925 stop:7052 length:1128 start_codon:yes stop_codon:yes gene_type:complete
MDYPKSVPGVGLVNNQFVDEDPVNGTPGSLIPAAWGNAVTQELLAVIQAAGLVPSEASNAQLLPAIKSLSLGGVLTLSASATLPATSRGLVLMNATAAAVTVTLPAAETVGVLELTLRRTDAAANAAVIAANGADRIMLDTTAEAAGQASTELLFAGDYLRLRSDGAGKWWCVGQAQLPGSIASGLVAFTAPGSHTFTVPPVLRSGRRVPTITVVGGGGGGGEGPSGWRGAGGGGGGAGILRRSLAGVLSVAVTVGAGGVGGVGLSVGGQTGGSSSFGAYVSATGGGGGGDNPGGFPGAAPGADATLIGAHGSDGSGGGGGGGSGDGGASAFGGGGRSGSSTGLAGCQHGGGGGGGTGGAGRGGDGAGGLVLIQW